MLLVRNQTAGRALGGAAIVLAALFAFSNTSARGQNTGIYQGAPQIVSPATTPHTIPGTPLQATTAPNATATTAQPTATTGTNWHSFSIDQLLQQISRMRQERGSLDRQQKEIEAVLVQKVRRQQVLIRKLGIDIDKGSSEPPLGKVK